LTRRKKKRRRLKRNLRLKLQLKLKKFHPSNRKWKKQKNPS
jgi:hypothetical protein